MGLRDAYPAWKKAAKISEFATRQGGCTTLVSPSDSRGESRDFARCASANEAEANRQRVTVNEKVISSKKIRRRVWWRTVCGLDHFV
jgi:hypothetical protein